MSLLRRIEGARPGQPEQPQQPGAPQQPPKPPAEGPLSQSTAPARDAQRDVRSRLQSRIINNLDPRLELSDATFVSDEHVSRVIERIIAPIGRRVDEAKPFEDARLPDGSRVNIIIPPLALNGPTVTIRKFPKYRITVEDYIKFGTATAEM